jgi:hypothetical protein
MGTRKKKKEYPWLNYLVSHNPSHLNGNGSTKVPAVRWILKCSSIQMVSAALVVAIAKMQPRLSAQAAQ